MRFLIPTGLIALAAPAIAQTTPSKLLVGNTLIGDYGKSGKIIFKARADGSVIFTTPEGQTVNGHWVADDKYLCIISPPAKPNTGLPTHCEQLDLPKRQVGKSWSMIDSYGEAVTATINKGQ